MLDAEVLDLLRRGVVALEKLAGIEAPRARKPATIGTAIYDHDERERKKIGETIRQQKPEPPI